MILDLFIVLLFIACFLIVIGLMTPYKYLAVVGFVFLFILFSWVLLHKYTPTLSNGLQYRIGSNVTTIGSTSEIVYLYDTYDDDSTYWIGYLGAIVSFFSMWIVVVVTNKQGG
jgi:hypothetical protein